MREADLKKLVIDEFSGNNAQSLYIQKATEGLWKSEEELIDKYFIKNGNVLDIGCGTGRTTIVLLKKGYQVTGIDITPRMIENAKKIAQEKNLEINYSIGDATKLNMPDESFDNALFSNQGWTQIPGKNNRLKSLGETYRILKPNGIFIFTFHQRKWPGKYLLFWSWEWFKFYILKSLKFKIDELDFGDRFFKRESTETEYQTKQYIHIASIREVTKQIKKFRFRILYIGRGLSEHSGSKPMFVVCQKNDS